MLEVLGALLKALVVGTIVYVASLQYLTGGSGIMYGPEQSQALKGAGLAAMLTLVFHKWKDKKTPEAPSPQEPPDQQK